jgi:dTDP-L-rhamnose 4-epimerase
MKVLIVGGAGFIGSHTALRLAQQGHEPLIFDSLDPQIHGSDAKGSPCLRTIEGKFPLIVADTRDRAALDAALRETEAVLYLPACTGTGQSMYQVERYSDVNTRGAAVFCEALAQAKDRIRRVVVSSTRAIYGEGAATCPVHGRVVPQSRAAEDLEAGRFETSCPRCAAAVTPEASCEDDPSSPVSIYGITKLAQEHLIANIGRALEIPVTIFRYQNVYGPGQSLNNAYTGILSIFTQLLMAGREINLFEDGNPTRDFVFIDDVAEYNVRALLGEAPGIQALNVGCGVRSTLFELVDALAAGLGVEARYRVSGQFRLGDIRHAVADLSQLTAALGPREFTGLHEGVAQFVRWVQTEGTSADANERFDKSLDEMKKAGLLRGAKTES